MQESSINDTPGVRVLNSRCSPQRTLRTFPMPQFKFCFVLFVFF